ncbi:hypothetical protein SDC9_164552 [bioreactor metagenome]|uniref:Uncharacterized protein n=1 Tax=bioreactor metagenome TaxID=1076179 RepID=A0A645FU82_9ZZZZ
MLNAWIKLAAVHGNFHVHIIIYAAHGVHDFFDHVHIKADIIIDGNAKKLGYGAGGIGKAVFLRAASRGKRGINLGERRGFVGKVTLCGIDFNITIPRHGNNIHFVGGKINGDEHDGIRAEGPPVFPLGALVNPQHQDIGPVFHEIQIRLAA